jgi:hypothetical protein
VTASLPSGGLSEWFPNALATKAVSPASFSTIPVSLRWIGRLLPPFSPLSAQIPHTEDAPGRHYNAARAVPDAWLFNSSIPVQAVGSSMPGHQIDRMIFYRGAAELYLPFSVQTQDDQTFVLKNHSTDPVPAVVALQSSPEGIAWVRLEKLPPMDARNHPEAIAKAFSFPKPMAREEAVTALRQVMIESLVAQGLTSPEASAMVETWRDLWFGETGTRVLAILPDPWVTQNVPLQVEPPPAHLARVYVSRLEILTHARENALQSLLTENSDLKVASQALKTLDLGRFTQGALRRAKDLQSQKLDARFYEVTSNSAH